MTEPVTMDKAVADLNRDQLRAFITIAENHLANAAVDVPPAAEAEDEQRIGYSAYGTVHCAGLPLTDLRVICDEPEDYANPIEPSVQGGAKIARAIVEVVIGSG